MPDREIVRIAPCDTDEAVPEGEVRRRLCHYGAV